MKIHPIFYLTFLLILLLGNVSNSYAKSQDVAFEEYLSKKYPNFKAFVVSNNRNRWGRAYGYTTVIGAIKHAIFECEKKGHECKLYAIGNVQVFDLQTSKRRAKIKAYSDSIIPIVTKSAKGVRLTSIQIKDTFSGKIFSGKTVTGIFADMTLSKDGAVSSKPTAGQNLPSVIANGDSGKWWTKNDNLCRQYDNWYRGEERCNQVWKKNDVYRFFKGNDVTVTGKFNLSK